jgi:hypothetical protein
MTTMNAAADTLARLDRGWDTLENTVTGLDGATLSEVRDPAGWAAKDHLMHVAAWEEAFLASLDGRPRHEALGIDAALLRDGDDNSVNAAIFSRHRDRPLPDVLAAIRTTHAALRARVAALRDEASLAEVPGPTWEHYEEHLGWIRELVRRGARAST